MVRRRRVQLHHHAALKPKGDEIANGTDRVETKKKKKRNLITKKSAINKHAKTAYLNLGYAKCELFNSGDLGCAATQRRGTDRLDRI